MLIQEVQKHLEEVINPFWKKMIDEENGGYYGLMDYDLNIAKDAPKSVILHSRILWFFANEYMLTKCEDDLKHATHAFEFLKKYCFDEAYEGVYWMVDAKGNVLEDMKHTYNQAFAIYALSSYYDAAKNEEALQLAKGLFEKIENTSSDEYGYKEAFSREWEEIDNKYLSDNEYLLAQGKVAEKTTNTLLHLMEAYTELYRVSLDEKVKEKLTRILKIIRERVYNSETAIFSPFFDKCMNSIADSHSYGHDIESAWLIDRAVEVLGDEALQQETFAYTLDVAKKVLEVGIENGVLNNERFEDHIDRTRVWWVQAEGVVGYINAYEKSGNEVYLQVAKDLWSYIKEYVIDKREGAEWHGELDAQDKIIEDPIVQPWKCPYHNGRMCFEVIRRNVNV